MDSMRIITSEPLEMEQTKTSSVLPFNHIFDASDLEKTKVGYAEFVGRVLYLYDTASKGHLIGSVSIPDDMGITEAECRSIIQSYGYITEEEVEIELAKKQDTISDLETIRSGAEKGSTALQEVPSTYRTAEEQDKIHDATKQDVIDDLATIRSGASKGATALQSVPSTYRTAEEQDKIHDSTKQNTLTDADKQAIADLHQDKVTSVNGNTGAVTVSVPTKLSELTADATHRLVTDTEKTTWNGKQNALSTADKQAIADMHNDAVTSVNSQTGAVTIDIPTKVSELENDAEYHSDKIIAEKTYENVWNTHSTGTSSGDQYNRWYFGKFTPIDTSKEVIFKVRITGTMPRWTDDNLTANGLSPSSYGGTGSGANWQYGLHTAEVEIHYLPCMASAYTWQRVCVTQANTSYRSLYYMPLAYPKSKTQADQGEYFGTSIQNGYQYYNSTASVATALRNCFGRDITFQVLQADNCTVEFFDEKIEYLASNFPNHTITALGITSNGDTHTGDANQYDRLTTPVYKTLATPMTSYALLFNTSTVAKMGQWTSNTSNSTAQTKSFANVEFDIWNGLYYYGSTTVRATGYALAGTSLYDSITTFDLRYATNCGSNFLANTAGHNVYLILEQQTDGYFKVKPISRTISSKTYNIEVCDDTMLPTTEDGYYYLLIGHTSSTNRYTINFPPKHPVYKHNGTYMEYVGTC